MDARVRVALAIGAAVVVAVLAGGAAYTLIPRDRVDVVADIPGIEVPEPTITPEPAAPPPPEPQPVAPAPPAPVEDDDDDDDDDEPDDDD
jgi:hypothetical protein